MKFNKYFGRCDKCDGVKLADECPNCNYRAKMLFPLLDVNFVQEQCGEGVHFLPNRYDTTVSCLACFSTGFVLWNCDKGRPALVSGDFLESIRKAKADFDAVA